MTDDSSADDHGAADPEAFEEWLDQAADSKGVSRQELMNQMLSSYWILDELSGLVGEAESKRSTGHQPPGPADSTAEPETPDTSDTTGSDGAPTEPSTETASTESTDGSSTEESIREIQAAIQQLVENQSAAEGPKPSSRGSFDPSQPLDGGVVSVVSELQRQVGKFDSRIDDLDEKQSAQFDRLSNELQLALDRVNELERKQDRFVEADDLDSLAQRLNGELEEVDGELEAIEERVEALQTADDELESRMEREFDSIESLFRRVLDTLDELESEVGATSESYQSELEPLQQRETERKQLEELKNEALIREIRRGNCESCGQRIDLGMLESPECPNCSSRFVGIEDNGWNLFRSPTIKTKRAPLD